jgi:peptide/nickel transport system substrate-binding protein
MLRRRPLKLLLLLLTALTFVLVAASCGGDDDEGGGDGGTLVFATASDPVVLDGALVSDGESLRAVLQMFEGLTALRPGTTEVVPGLAESWEPSPNGLQWTFNLRDGVEFHDGEPLNAEAVCFNFDRQYNFKGAFQNANVSYYWQYGLGGGFANPIEGAAGPKDSLYKSCQAVDDLTVRLNLNKPSSTLLAALTLPSLAIQSPKALQQYGADQGTADEEGVLRPAGTYGTQHPTGTGPFKFESWNRGDRLVLVRNEDYWGDPPELEELIFRPISENAARLQALQTGEIQGYDFVEPQDFDTIRGDDNLQLLERPAFNVGYIGFNQQRPPLDRLQVRQAIAHAINRPEVVETFYAGQGQVATQFQPPELFGWAQDVRKYDYNPQRSRQLLQQAGLDLPVEIEFWYPTDVSRPYMPDPARNFQAFASDLNAAGFRVRPRTAPWSPDYTDLVDGGRAQVYLLGWIGDFGDPDNFIGTFFQDPGPDWGFENAEISNLLDRAERETDENARERLYQQANRAIMEFLPGLPYVHAKSALAFRADVTGYEPSPTQVELFSRVSLGD